MEHSVGRSHHSVYGGGQSGDTIREVVYVRQKLSSPFDLKRAAAEAKAATMDEATTLAQAVLGAAEIDPEQAVVIETTEEFSIVLTGMDRPDWSRRAAGKIARAQESWRYHLINMNKTAMRMTGKGAVSVPNWHGVFTCPICHELQAGSSRATRRSRECGICSSTCTAVPEHRSNQINCDECRTEMQLIWSTNDEIPKDWLI